MFLGKFLTTFSGKNRIVLPKKFRQELGLGIFYLLKGFDGEIWGFNAKEWEKEAQKRLSEDFTTTVGREKRRIFFSNSEICSLDSQGRFIIPEVMVQTSNLKSEILILGAGDHFEIWDPQILEQLENDNRQKT
jgi:MraZ protein